MTQILASLHTSTETIQEQSDILLREDMAMDKYQDLAKQMKPEIIETWKAKHKKQVEELLYTRLVYAATETCLGYLPDDDRDILLCLIAKRQSIETYAQTHYSSVTRLYEHKRKSLKQLVEFVNIYLDKNF